MHLTFGPIFLYGGITGSDIPSTVDMGAVRVLSLPSFHWYKGSTASTGRYRASCNLAANRQMIVVSVVMEQFSSVFEDVC